MLNLPFVEHKNTNPTYVNLKPCDHIINNNFYGMILYNNNPFAASYYDKNLIFLHTHFLNISMIGLPYQNVFVGDPEMIIFSQLFGILCHQCQDSYMGIPQP